MMGNYVLIGFAFAFAFAYIVYLLMAAHPITDGDKKCENIFFFIGPGPFGPFGPFGHIGAFFGWALGPFTASRSGSKTRAIGRSKKKKKKKKKSVTVFNCIDNMNSGTFKS